jgi:hypothetical protein
VNRYSQIGLYVFHDISTRKKNVHLVYICVPFWFTFSVLLLPPVSTVSANLSQILWTIDDKLTINVYANPNVRRIDCSFTTSGCTRLKICKVCSSSLYLTRRGMNQIATCWKPSRRIYLSIFSWYMHVTCMKMRVT